MDFKHVHLRKITLLSCDRCNLLHPHSLIPHPQSSIEKRRVLTQFFYWTSPPPLLNPPAVPRAGYYPGHIPFFQFRNTPVLMYGKLQKQNENNWYSINPCFTPSLEQIIPTNIPQFQISIHPRSFRSTSEKFRLVRYMKISTPCVEERRDALTLLVKQRGKIWIQCDSWGKRDSLFNSW